MVNMAMVGYFLPNSRKKPTRQQSTEMKIHRLLAIILILRLVPRYCWLVVVLGQNERCHGRSDAQRFCFCCSTRDVRARKRFLIDLRAIFFRKGAPTVNLEKNRGVAFPHDSRISRRSDLAQCTFEYLVRALRY
jgi:hypothetical protein